MTETLDETTDVPEGEPVEPQEPDTDDGEPEPENPDAEPPEEPLEPEEAPQAVAPKIGSLTPEQFERAAKSVDRRAESYVKFVAEFAETAEQPISRCPVCLPNVPGFVFDPAQVPWPEYAHEAARTILGKPPIGEYPMDTQAATCTTCEGYGKVRSGSKVHDQEVLRCLNCNGRGWVGPRATRQPDNLPGLVEVPTLAPEDQPVDVPKVDPWGRAPDDRLYGVLPGFERREAMA